jgi:hypothetical protein
MKVSKSPEERNMRKKPHFMAIGGKLTKQDHATLHGNRR